VGEIKSAWELAMEKVERLGKLSPEELKRQKEEKCGSIGHVLADKYLGGIGLWQLQVELDKYSAEEKELVKQALKARLVQSIELGNYERLICVIQGIIAVNSVNSAVSDVGERIEQLFDEYERDEEKEVRQLEKSAGEVLHQLGISGSAIRTLDPKVLSRCQESLARLAQPYGERLEVLKKELVDRYHV